jgi:hypothetical protein
MLCCFSSDRLPPYISPSDGLPTHFCGAKGDHQLHGLNKFSNRLRFVHEPSRASNQDLVDDAFAGGSASESCELSGEGQGQGRGRMKDER